MTIGDARFPSEIVTKKGKVFIFDDVHCILGYMKENPATTKNIKDIYLTDYTGDHSFINVNNAHLFRSPELRSPMNGNIAAFSNTDSMNRAMETFKGESVVWSDLIK